MHFITLILKNLIRRPTQTVLTVLGLSVSVTCMVALLGISHRVEESVLSAFERRRIDLVVTQAGRSSGLNSDFREYLVEQARKIPGVEAVASAVVNLIDVTRDSGYTDQVMIMGWQADNFSFEHLTFLAGRKFEPGEQKVVLLGNILANNLGKGVGDRVTFGRPDEGNTENVYEVIGVFRSNVVFEDGAAVVPIDEGRRLTGMQVTGFSVRVRKSSPDSDAEVAAVRQHIEALRDPQDPSVRLAAQSPAEYTASISHLKVVRATSWIVSVIASLVGVIGVLNTMAMSVLERTQEIGILRAVGWPGRRVIRMILGEAVLMALAAAAVGSVTARLATELLTRFPQVNGFIEAEIAPFVFVQGFGLTLLIGLLGGLYPAIRASRLLPSEAIRHD